MGSELQRLMDGQLSWDDGAVADKREASGGTEDSTPQIWRLYSKAKEQLPNAARVENLTWRMMAMTLRKAGKSRYGDRQHERREWRLTKFVFRINDRDAQLKRAPPDQDRPRPPETIAITAEPSRSELDVAWTSEYTEHQLSVDTAADGGEFVHRPLYSEGPAFSYHAGYGNSLGFPSQVVRFLSKHHDRRMLM